MANRIITAAVTGETIKLSSNDAGAAGSFNAVSLAFTFDSAWDGTTSKIVQFLDAYGANPVNITLGEEMLVSGAYIVPIPAEPLVYAGEINVTVRGVDFETDGATVERIIMSASAIMKVKNSLYKVGGATPVEPTPTQAEQLLASVNSVTGMTVSATALATGAPATVTKTTNVDDTINLAFGLPAGGKGDTGNTGLTGATGNGISSVVLNGDYTLTINFTDSTSTTTTSIRGATGATGAKGDTGATGNGIASVTWISGTHAAGTTDTYRITFTDTTTFDFAVYNGANGEGSGDMVASVYDPTNKNADAFARENHTGTQLKSTISDFPTEMTPTAHKTSHATGGTDVITASDIGASASTHTHGNITNDGKIGSTADLIVVTGASGAVTTKTPADTKTLLGISDGPILSVTVGTPAPSISLDLSSLSTNNYASIIVRSEVMTADATTVSCALNGTTMNYGGCYMSSGSTSVTTISGATSFGAFPTTISNGDYKRPTSIELKIKRANLGVGAVGIQTSLNIDFSGGEGVRFGSCKTDKSADTALSSVQFVAASGNILAGSKFYVYGVKK